MLTLTQTETIEPVVELTPRQQAAFRAAFAQYQRQKEAVEAAHAALDKCKETLGRLRMQVGEESVGLDGFKITLVQGVQSRLNKRKLRLVGVTQAQIEAATITSPKKPYELVTCPGDKRRGQEDDE